MKKFNQITLIFCGLLMLAAFPVFGQDKSPSGYIKIKRKPWQDFRRSVIEKIKKDNLDLAASFSLEGNIKKDFDQNIISFTKTEGDEKMVEVAKDLVKVFSDSGYLEYFRKLGSEEINFKLTQDADRIYGNISLVQRSEERARLVKNMFDLLIISKLAREKAKNNGLDHQDFFLIERVDFETEEKNMIINFDYQKLLVQELIQRVLIKAQNQNLKA